MSFGIPRSDEHSMQHATYVRVQDWRVFVESEGLDSPGRVPADPLERKELLLVIGKCSAITGHCLTSDTVQAVRSNIVPEGVPGLSHIVDRGLRQILEGGISF